MTTISDLQDRCGQAAGAKGFHEDRPRPARVGATVAGQKEAAAALANWQGNKLMLIVSELAEAQDELRKGRGANETYYPIANEPGIGPWKPEGVPSELADVVIRVLDFCYTEGIDLETIIDEKLAYNATRAHLHGRKF